MSKQMKRCERDGILSGVCAGLAKYFDIDVFLIRLIFICLIPTDVPIGIIYFILAIAMPDD